jgi:CRP-like cAMP-binding protein
MVIGLVAGGAAVTAAGAFAGYRAMDSQRSAEVLHVPPLTTTVRMPRQVCSDVVVSHEAATKDPNQLTGAVIGAVAGDALITQMAQTAVCNRHHSVDQQLCRWLLLSLDRLSSNELIMTQDHIANMLGARREGFTEATGKLQKLGVIRYSRGRIKMLDRPQLERLCCECYGVLKKETDRLQQLVAGRRG